MLVEKEFPSKWLSMDITASLFLSVHHQFFGPVCDYLALLFLQDQLSVLFKCVSLPWQELDPVHISNGLRLVRFNSANTPNQFYWNLLIIAHTHTLLCTQYLLEENCSTSKEITRNIDPIKPLIKGHVSFFFKLQFVCFLWYSCAFVLAKLTQVGMTRQLISIWLTMLVHFYVYKSGW